jgi:hypothetical protein
MEPEAGNERRRRYDGDAIVIQLPRIDPGLRDLLIEMIPGRALFRLLSNVPEDVVVHTRNARREQLLAIRSLIDGLIAETEKAQPRRREREVEIE